MKKFLITGADGFIGSHLVEYLLAEGHWVRCLIQYNSFGNCGWLKDVSRTSSLEFVYGDVRDANCCNELLSGIDIVIHLAALISIPYSYDAPRSYVDVNILGTMNICDAARSADLEQLVLVSTSEVYGTAKYTPIDEVHPLQPQSPYSASKISAEMLGESFYRCFGVPVTIVRPFNTYGPRQSSRAIIPTVITQILNKNSFIRLGNLSATRDFNYVDDTVRYLYQIAMRSDLVGQVINIGSGSEVSIKALVRIISNKLEAWPEVSLDAERLRPKNSEVERLVCDNSRLRSHFNDLSFVDLSDGLDLTIDWFKANYTLNHEGSNGELR